MTTKHRPGSCLRRPPRQNQRLTRVTTRALSGNTSACTQCVSTPTTSARANWPGSARQSTSEPWRWCTSPALYAAPREKSTTVTGAATTTHGSPAIRWTWSWPTYKATWSSRSRSTSGTGGCGTTCPAPIPSIPRSSCSPTSRARCICGPINGCGSGTARTCVTGRIATTVAVSVWMSLDM